MSSNEVMDIQTLLKISEQQVYTAGKMQEQIGIIYEKSKDHEDRLISIEARQDKAKKDFDKYVALQQERERIEPSEYNEIQIAKENRVSDLLREYDRFDLYGKFCAKLLKDARKEAGYNGYYTMAKYMDSLLKYIGTWEPKGHGGVIGYINHLDSLARLNAKNIA